MKDDDFDYFAYEPDFSSIDKLKSDKKVLQIAPAAWDHEEACLCALLNEAAFKKCTLLAKDFKNITNRNIFEKMLELNLQNKPAWHFYILSAALLKNKNEFDKLQTITGGKYSGDNSVEPSFLPFYEDDLRAYNNSVLVKEIIEKHGTDDPALISNKLQEAITTKVENNVFDHSKEIIELIKEMEELNASPGGLIGLSTGLKDLDEYLGGLKPKSLVIIGSRPSMGKSCFGVNLALNIARQGKHVYIQALEENVKDIMRRFISNISGVSMSDLMHGRLSHEDWTKIVDAQEKAQKLGVTIDQDSGLNSSEICQRIKKVHSFKKIDLVIIDHLQEIFEEGEQNRHLAISKSLHNIKATTKNLSIPTIILCQINREVEKRHPPKPLMSDLKESGDIEAIADSIMLLYREKYYKQDLMGPDILEVSIAKQRNGQRGVVRLHFDGERMRILDY